MRVGSQRHTPAALPSGEGPVPIVWAVWWVPGTLWTGAENLFPTGIRSPYLVNLLVLVKTIRT